MRAAGFSTKPHGAVKAKRLVFTAERRDLFVSLTGAGSAPPARQLPRRRHCRSTSAGVGTR